VFLCQQLNLQGVFDWPDVGQWVTTARLRVS
jgi:hypothetical protein